MICLETVRRYCKDPIEWIENYQEAVNDNTQTWHCHHHYEIEYNLSSIDLQALGFYFNVPAKDLIFLTASDHLKLHNASEIMKNIKQSHIKHNISKEALSYLYVELDLTMQQIAEVFNCSQTCIFHKLEKYQIPKKDMTEWKKQHPNSGQFQKGRIGSTGNQYGRKYYINKDELYDLYINQNLSSIQIATLKGCHYDTIRTLLKKYNLHKSRQKIIQSRQYTP